MGILVLFIVDVSCFSRFAGMTQCADFVQPTELKASESDTQSDRRRARNQMKRLIGRGSGDRRASEIRPPAVIAADMSAAAFMAHHGEAHRPPTFVLDQGRLSWRPLSFEPHRAAVALHVAYYNLARKHESLKCSPAMTLGVTDRVCATATQTQRDAIARAAIMRRLIVALGQSALVACRARRTSPSGTTVR